MLICFSLSHSVSLHPSCLFLFSNNVFQLSPDLSPGRVSQMPFNRASASHYHGIEWVSSNSTETVQLQYLVWCSTSSHEKCIMTSRSSDTNQPHHSPLLLGLLLLLLLLQFLIFDLLYLFIQILSGQPAVLGPRPGLCKTPVPSDSVWDPNHLLQGALCPPLRPQPRPLPCCYVRTRKCARWRDSAERWCCKTQAQVMGHGHYWRLSSQEVWWWYMFLLVSNKKVYLRMDIWM